jgi:hypothetical protein
MGPTRSSRESDLLQVAGFSAEGERLRHFFGRVKLRLEPAYEQRLLEWADPHGLAARCQQLATQYAGRAHFLRTHARAFRQVVIQAQFQQRLADHRLVFIAHAVVEGALAVSGPRFCFTLSSIRPSGERSCSLKGWATSAACSAAWNSWKTNKNKVRKVVSSRVRLCSRYR